ncbi:hypothetical protein [Nocardia sp. NPDC050710]|uniref:esterase/lipase family protein n=1 Tax=Nocardia sp. NPDC050710 TaxID=3157220 RepID=UPI0033F07F68
MKLVLVHGRSQQGKDPMTLQKEWTDALTYGLARANAPIPLAADVSFAYYGDLLAGLVAGIEEALPADVASRGLDSGQPSYALAQRAILADIVANVGLSPQSVASEAEDIQARDPQNWGWVLAATRALSRIPGLDSRVIDTFVRDVSLYVTNSAARRAVDRVVHDTLGSEPFVLVAHSLGTVVAYNVLRSPDRPAPCAGLVTLGSPLGISGIRSRLDSPLEFPDDLETWFNAFDKADIVALRPLDSEHFDVDPPVENYDGVLNFTSNRHGIAGYLADPVVAGRIADLVTARTVG